MGVFQVAENAKNVVLLQFSLLIRSGIWHLRWQEIVLMATSHSQPGQLPWPWHSSVHMGYSCLISAAPGCTCESDQPNHTNRWQRPSSQLRTCYHFKSRLMFHRHQTEAVADSSVSLVQLTPAFNNCRAPTLGLSWCHSRANYKNPGCKVNSFSEGWHSLNGALSPGPSAPALGSRH